MTPEQAAVDEFHEVFGLARPKSFVGLDFDGQLRINLMREELDEFEEAWGASSVLGMVDALCDLLYVTHGSGVSMGLDLEPHFQEVHVANMRKLGPDGKPLLRHDGKLLKPPGWVGPDHAKLLDALPFGVRYEGRASMLAGAHGDLAKLKKWLERLDEKDAEISRLRQALKMTEAANADALKKNGTLLEEVRRLREDAT